MSTAGLISGQANVVNNININNNGAAENCVIKVVPAENKKSIIGHHRNTNIDILTRKRQWE